MTSLGELRNISFDLAIRLNPITWTGTASRRSVARIRELASIQGEATAPDALGEAVLHPFEFRNALVDPPRPSRGQLRPVGAIRRPVPRQPRELNSDFLQRQADLLREHDERDAAEHAARIAAMAGAGPLRGNQTLLLIKP